MSKTGELRTSDVAKLIGIPADLLRKWKYRGFLKLAPQGVPGQGRSVECFWSEEAVAEVRAWAEKPRPSGRTRKRRGMDADASATKADEGLEDAA